MDTPVYFISLVSRHVETRLVDQPSDDFDEMLENKRTGRKTFGKGHKWHFYFFV
jgi:hypothetical protein